MALAELAHAQRLGQSERVRGAGLIGLRRDHPDIVGEIGGDLLEHVETGGLDAVVIGDQDAHCGVLSIT